MIYQIAVMFTALLHYITVTFRGNGPKSKGYPDVKWNDNKAGYTATSVACGWAGAVFEVTCSLGQEQ